MFQPTAPRLVLLIIRHCIHNLYTYIYWSYSKSDKADKYCHNYLILKWGKAHVEEFMIKCAHSYLLSFVIICFTYYTVTIFNNYNNLLIIKLNILYNNII